MKITKLRYGSGKDPLIEHLKLHDIQDAHASIGTVVFKEGQRVPAGDGRSAHDQDEVSLILDGKITLDTEDESTILESGTLIHIPAGIAHSSVAIEDTKIFFMLIG